MKGKIDKIFPYKTGLGAFVWINGKKYAHYGNVGFHVDEKVEFEEGKPMQDNTPTIKTIRHEGIEAFVEKTIKENKVCMDILAGKEPEQDRVAYLSCLKSACIYMSKCQASPESIISYADAFYKRCLREKSRS